MATTAVEEVENESETTLTDDSTATLSLLTLSHSLIEASVPELAQLTGGEFDAEALAWLASRGFGLTGAKKMAGNSAADTAIYRLNYHGHTVAVKLFDRSRMGAQARDKSLPRELRACIRLNNADHIVHTLAILHAHCLTALVMEYADRGTLDGLLYRVEGGLRQRPGDYGHYLSRQVVEGVAFMHRHRMAHRDLKPENVLIDRFGNAKIADLGFSIVVEEGVISRRWCGSTAYMAPEVTLHEPYLPLPADMWSLGVVLFQMAFGCLPFPDNSHIDRISNQLIGLIDWPLTTTTEERSLVRPLVQAVAASRPSVAQLQRHSSLPPPTIFHTLPNDFP